MNKDRNNAKPKPRTIDQFMADQIRIFGEAFKVPMKITVIARRPGEPESELVFTDDDIDGVIATLQRRRDGVKQSQAAA